MGHPGIEMYRRQQLEAMTPERLVLVALEQGMRACRQADKARAQRAVVELIGGLNFDYPEQAGGLLSLYDWVLQLLGEDRLEEAAAVIDRLRGAWAQALACSAGSASAGAPGWPPTLGPARPPDGLPEDLTG
jgi:flagellin-specific chaperone FliS